MPWRNDPAKRDRDRRVYGDPAYQANRRVALQRAGGRCEQCGATRRRLEVDHIVPLTVRIDHSPGNLMVVCAGPGSCHARKTAQDANRARSQNRGEPEPSSPTRW